MSAKEKVIRKVAVISHDYNLKNKYGFEDFSEHFHSINSYCDDQKCDTILYALYTWHENSPEPRNQDSIFKDFSSVKTIILEIGTFKSEDHFLEIWQKDVESPRIVRQYFSHSNQPEEKKERFIADIKSRIIGDAFLMICGESNIVNTVQKDKSVRDIHQFNEILKSNGIQYVFNPIHDYMRRYEMKLKRRYYSLDKRAVISVWNKGKIGKDGKRIRESKRPWTFFFNGINYTDSVQETMFPLNDRTDIRIGIIPEIHELPII